MRRQEHPYIRSSPTFRAIQRDRPAEHHLAYVLAQSHPLALDPKFDHHLSSTGKWMTYLRWFDVSIRIVYFDHRHMASAMAFLSRDASRVSPRAIILEERTGRIAGNPHSLFDIPNFRPEITR